MYSKLHSPFQALLLALVLACSVSACNSAEQSTEDSGEVPNGMPTVDETPSAEQAEMPLAVEFPSLDGLPVSGHLYEVDAQAPVIVLCHQARFNKFEYAGIAPKLNEMGFNCLAIDQRSGGPISTEPNLTYLNALEQEKSTDYLDAEQDMIAAVNYAADKYQQDVILWGSSYSSTLALYIGVENERVKAVLSFSPGNYLADDKGSLIDKLEGFAKPLFVTSSKSEAEEVGNLLAKAAMNDQQTVFKPEGNGHHGSRALWEGMQGGEEYWTAIQPFLESLL